MKKALEVTLGIVTSIGGYLDAGSIATSAAAGALFGFRLGWALLLGTICIIFLVEMAGRLAAVSGHTLTDGMRERLGFRAFFPPFVVLVVVDFFVLIAEIGGICFALQLLGPVNFYVWAIPVALIVWVVLWRSSFKVIENGVATLGLVTVVFLMATVAMHPSLGEMASGFVPSLPSEKSANYLFTAVSILGAVIAPYLLTFYSSGAIEDKWKEEDVPTNRIVATLGMSFGAIVSFGVMATAALALHPEGVEVKSYLDAGSALKPVFHSWGVPLFGVCLLIACFGAALEISLDISYVISQALGLNWGKSQKPSEDARFTLIYSAVIFAASVPVVLAVNPLKVTLFSMALTATILPIIVLPFLVLMNDASYLKNKTNGWLANSVAVVTACLALVLAVVSIPLEIIGG